MRFDREARRPHHPHGQPRAGGLRQLARGLRARVRAHPVAGQRAGDHPLAGRDVRPGAGGILGQQGSPCRDAGLSCRDPEKPEEGGRHKDLSPRQGQGDRHAPQAAQGRAHVHRRRLQLRRADRGRCRGLLGCAARHLRLDRAGGLARALRARERRQRGVPRSAGAHRAAFAPYLLRADALLQDRRRVHGLAQRPPGPLRDGRRPAVGAPPAAFLRAVQARRRRRAAVGSAARLRAHEATSRGARMRLTKLGSFGLEADAISPDFRKVWDAFFAGQILVFRNLKLKAAQFLELARRFGRPEPHVIDQFHHPEHADILILSNVKKDGAPIGLADAGTYFHTDYSYLEVPARATLLYSIQVPSKGGDTLFANQYAAYDDLPGTMKHKLESLVALHHYGNRHDLDHGSRTVASVLSEEQEKKVTWVRHPVVRRHPVTGRKALYAVSGSSFGIEGMPQDEAIDLRSEEHTSELQSRLHLVCRLLLEKKKK